MDCGSYIEKVRVQSKRIHTDLQGSYNIYGWRVDLTRESRGSFAKRHDQMGIGQSGASDHPSMARIRSLI